MKSTTTVFFSFLLCLCACNTDKSSFLPGYSGNEGEMVVVMDQQLWDGPAGDSIAALLLKPMPGLPQVEAIVKTVFVSRENFSRIFQTHRNLLFVSINEENKAKPPISIEKNNFAKEQLVIKVSASSQQQLLEVFTDNYERILWNFHQQEINRLIERNAKFGDDEVNKTVQEVTGLSFTSQKDAYVAKKYGSLVWVRIERERPVGGYHHQISQGLLVWSMPYSDTASFLDTNIIAEMEGIMKQHVPGPADSSYMTISYRMQQPVVENISFNSSYAKEIRGLWRMHNAHMGGPFYLLTFLDETSGRQYFALGYAFAPQFDKLPLLREVEAMAKSLKPPSSSEGEGT